MVESRGFGTAGRPDGRLAAKHRDWHLMRVIRVPDVSFQSTGHAQEVGESTYTGGIEEDVGRLSQVPA